MKRYILFIREKDRADIAELHPDRASARGALVSYVRTCERLTGEPSALHDDDAIAAWFSRDGAFYAIARARATRRAENDR